jgi:hypothetical protein
VGIAINVAVGIGVVVSTGLIEGVVVGVAFIVEQPVVTTINNTIPS